MTVDKQAKGHSFGRSANLHSECQNGTIFPFWLKIRKQSQLAIYYLIYDA